MSSSEQKAKPSVPINLSSEAVDDLIYDARAGDLEALNADIATLASQHSCPEWQIVASAIDLEDESEGGSGSCVLHFPSANGNIGKFTTRTLSFLPERITFPSQNRHAIFCFILINRQKFSTLCCRSYQLLMLLSVQH